MEASQFSRTIELAPDSSTGQLGSGLPIKINEDSQDAIFREFHNCGVHGTVVHLHQGTFSGKPATLLAFDFRFFFKRKNSDSRISKAEISVTFDALSSGNERDPSLQTSPPTVPVARRFCPSQIDGPPTPVRKTGETEVSMSISGPANISPVQIGIEGRKSKGNQFAKDYKMQIEGTRWSSDKKNGKSNNRVLWELSENSKQGEGIPKELHAAVAVQHDGKPFLATVEVKITTKILRMEVELFGWPWSTERPLLLSPNETFGPSMTLTEYDQLDDERWKEIAGFKEGVGYYRFVEWGQVVGP